MTPSLASIRVREKLLNEYNVPEEVITELYSEPAFFSRSSLSPSVKGDVEEVIARIDNPQGLGDDGYDSAIDEFIGPELDFDRLLDTLTEGAGDGSRRERTSGLEDFEYDDESFLMQFSNFRTPLRHLRS